MDKKLISGWTIFVNWQSCFEVICENSQSELRPPRQMTTYYLHAVDAALKYAGGWCILSLTSAEPRSFGENSRA